MKKYLPYVPGILVIIIVYVLSFGQTYIMNGWIEESKEIVAKQDNTALREYYEGIHLCRVGYEGITQAEIKRIKLLLQN